MINEIIKSEYFSYSIIVINVILLVLYLTNVILLKKINKKYKLFMKKIGNGKNLEEVLNSYLEKVEDVQNKNAEIIKYCKKLDDDISICIKKVGMVRYSAFKDTGSDLSFALALLNNNNDGIILNGIYSREMSNIYAKKIINGKCNNKLSEEEARALEIAINS